MAETAAARDAAMMVNFLYILSLFYVKMSTKVWLLTKNIKLFDQNNKIYTADL